MFDVQGTVTWNGKPLLSGNINLLPGNGLSLKIDPGKITAGRFRMKSTAGAKRVEIWANREKPGQNDVVMGLRAHEQYLPARYNGETKLKAEVTATGPNDFRFDLVEQDEKPRPR